MTGGSEASLSTSSLEAVVMLQEILGATVDQGLDATAVAVRLMPEDRQSEPAINPDPLSPRLGGFCLGLLLPGPADSLLTILEQPVEPGDEHRPSPALLQLLADVGGSYSGWALPVSEYTRSLWRGKCEVLQSVAAKGNSG
jgi:hypothetical protein